MIKKSLFFIIAILLISCSSSHPIVRTTRAPYHKQTTPRKSGSVTKSENQNQTNNSKSEVLEATTRVKVTTEMVLDYISKYKETAKKIMVKYGIPSSIILGQGILESGAGTGPLSSIANNHFGIKCHNDWTGPSVKYDDDAAQECFRKYDQPGESYADHAVFLSSRPRYKSLFQLEKGDYKQWAKGLKDAGYATDPKYPDKLIGIIERYQLNKYDSEVLGTEYVPTTITNNESIVKSDLYQVSQGDTLYSIARKFRISIDDLKRKNNIEDNTISIGQNLIVK
jgi:flagellum-specific peptidoglycan hydrolase FlgJ